MFFADSSMSRVSSKIETILNEEKIGR